MYIEKIQLNNFRNYNTAEINLNKELNIFVGNNAQGKTNIVEAIYLASIGKSFRTNKNDDMINLKNDTFFNIDIFFVKNDISKKMNIQLQKGESKQVTVNTIKLNKLSELIGNIHTILFSPDELKVIKQSPAIRRKFFDISISQLKPTYLYNVMQYNKILDQRNSLLKQMRFNTTLLDTIDVWNEKLINVGMKLMQSRQEFIQTIQPIIENKHKILSGDAELLNLKYIPDCKSEYDFKTRLERNLKSDIEKGFTGFGPHKDDYEFILNGIELNKYGSQGQQRTSILSYKLAEIDNMYNEINEYPILLLDDVTSELDKERITQLLNSLKNHQTIITCTDVDNFKEIGEYSLYKVENGVVTKIERM